MNVERTLIIPMFDEAARIEASLQALALSPLHAPETEILLVDDGSSDGTAEIAARVADELGLHARVIRLPENRGKGAAVQAGVAEATGKAVAFVDADLSAPPDAVVLCFEMIEAGKGDVIVTTRVHPEAIITEAPPMTRRYGGKIFNGLLRALGLTTMSDTQCGLKAFTAEAASELFAELAVQRFAFDVEVLQRATLAKLDVVELPIEWHHVEASRVRPLRDGARMAFDAVRIRRALSKPKRAAGAGADPAHSMDEDRFPVMARLERDHWWFGAKRRLVVEELAKLGVTRGAALDVGCGTGAMVSELRDAGLGPCVGTDLSEGALQLAATTHGDGWGVARAEALPFPDDSFACLTSLDVIEHLDSDVEGLREYRRVLSPDGVLVVAVPAYQWAWSDHDVALGHRRRYTAPMLRASLEAAGFDVVRVSYFHSWLVPPAFVLRRTPLRALVRGSAEEASFVSPTMNRVLATVVAIERRVLNRVDVPFGLSVLAVARG